jgi:hypothetical protein
MNTAEAEITEIALAKIAYDHALKDMLNDDARIILSDFRKEIGKPDLTAEELTQAWKKVYPNYPITQRTANVILIHMSRKGKKQ